MPTPPTSAQLIGSFIHLKKKPKSQEALALLQRIAAHVKPIMQNRGWRVTTLAEFFPTQTNLLGTNYNRGSKISLRLRPHYNDSEFLSFEDILGTMLHELTHNAFGPHDAKFYALLDDLNIEYDKLLEKGFKGDDGDSLGGRTLSIVESKKLALSRALKASRGTGTSGRTLGGQNGAIGIGSQGTAVGAGISSAREIRERVASAAMRRLHDAKWCGHGHAEDPILVDEEEVNANDNDNDNGNEIVDQRRVDAKGTTIERRRDAIVSEQPSLSNSNTIDDQRRRDARSCKKSAPEVIVIISDDENSNPESLDTPPHQPPIPTQSSSSSTATSTSTAAGVTTRTIHSRRGKRSAGDVRSEEDYKRMKARGLIHDSLYDHLQKLRSTKSTTAKTLTTTSSNTTTSTRASAPSDAPISRDAWRCVVCTLLNSIAYESCSACESSKSLSTDRLVGQSKSIGEGVGFWVCPVCAVGNQIDRWMCVKCRRIKDTS